MKLIVAIITSHFVVASSLAQANFAWDRVGPGETGGLELEHIDHLYKFPDGNIWISSLPDGVVEYDGSTWTVRHTQGDRISIVSDRKGNVWTVNSSGDIERYKDGTWQGFSGSVTFRSSKRAEIVSGQPCYTQFSTIARPEVTNGIPYIGDGPAKIRFDATGRLWVIFARARPKAIQRFSNDILECWENDPVLGDQQVLGGEDMLALPRGTMWFLMRKERRGVVFIYAEEQWGVLPGPTPLLNRLILDTNNNVWGLGAGLYTYRAGEWQEVLGDLGGSAIAADEQGGIWCILSGASGNGLRRMLYHVNANLEVTAFPYPHDNEPERSHIVVGDDMQVWVGDRVGLFRMNTKPTLIQSSTWATVKTGVVVSSENR